MKNAEVYIYNYNRVFYIHFVEQKYTDSILKE
jgi:hypothetical protein